MVRTGSPDGSGLGSYLIVSRGAACLGGSGFL